MEGGVCEVCTAFGFHFWFLLILLYRIGQDPPPPPPEAEYDPRPLHEVSFRCPCYPAQDADYSFSNSDYKPKKR